MTHRTDAGSTPPDPATMTGLEVLRAVRDSPEHGPSIGRFLGMELEAVEEGRATFVIAARPEYANPLGSLHGGIYATVLDSAMACAVHSRLGAGVRYGTLEMKINFLRTVPTDGSVLRATGTVVHLGRSTAFAEGTITDERGRVVAHGTETCMIYG
ncbi:MULTISPECIES: PaaI family thioesterase [unclassified Leucobacter]|uniref:PaaI family thioesterase n=1 Tax=unclassified Leucobacter TaxID=2621730 RepID=UPI0006210367|nr:PaaI family thioesterase [Leucobacter sp. Ag1]KKI16568.1 thioesterase [Leucobacter sp. Ag1]